MVSFQSLDSQQGEINFRKQLAAQHISGEMTISDEFSADEIEKILKNRMHNTHQTMLKHMINFPIAPYLEIGAERGQRSLAIENELNLQGAALDLSYHMLNSCEFYQQKFEYEQIPFRICCDAHVLPFSSSSLPFVFCYQTLHHFEDFTPVIQEIRRVLAPGGHFYFCEEPFIQKLHLPLYKKKIYAEKTRQASLVKKMIDYFFAEKVCNETDFGIIEQDEIPLKIWREALKDFELKQVILSSPGGIKSRLNRLSFRQVINSLMGGLIEGLCKKPGKLPKVFPAIKALLICPDCRLKDQDNSLDSTFRCTHCNRQYPQKNGIVFLFTFQKLKQLYPEIAEEFDV